MYDNKLTPRNTDLIMYKTSDATMVVDWMFGSKVQDDSLLGFGCQCTTKMLEFEDTFVAVDTKLNIQT